MVFYLYGKNSFAINHQAGLIKSKYIEKTKADVDLANINVDEQGIGNLLGNLLTMPMFVSSRLVVVSNLAHAKPTQQQIDAIINTTSATTNLVVLDPNPDKRTLLYKAMRGLKGAKEFNILNPQQLLKWLLAESHKLGSTLSSQTASYLIDLVGIDQWSLYNELAKLASYNSTITKSSIDELATQTLENSAFVLAEALVRKDLVRVIKLYKQLHLQGYADQMILGAIIYQFRVLMVIIINDSKLTSAYKLSPYATQKARSLVGGLDLDDIARAYREIAKSDIATKTGELSSKEAMHSLFYSLCK